MLSDSLLSVMEISPQFTHGSPAWQKRPPEARPTNFRGSLTSYSADNYVAIVTKVVSEMNCRQSQRFSFIIVFFLAMDDHEMADVENEKRSIELLERLIVLRRELESKICVEGGKEEQPNVKFEDISELVPSITDLASKVVRHVLEDDADEHKQLLETLSHEEDSQGKELAIALLGKPDVGKSFVCSTLASLGLAPQDAEKLESMALHGTGTTRSSTTMVTEFRWGPQVTREVKDSICRVTVPSPLLKEFNVRLVDVSICSSLPFLRFM